ncbi:hypothetical protein QJS10_CPB14g01424 [Acorus calamus]|uniref:Reverse transcriptase n=1 Tax=Acorus calamus TaxID=4465 RepID=A0AAV9DDM4_ACOCL|nr:hypothetical protein QJS10_CPB14g01424 [Acorus calamus]
MIRNDLWEETSEVLKTGLPILVAGDFNTLLYSEDKQGGVPFRVSPEVLQFRRWVEDNQLQPLVVKGGLYTWCNNRRGHARTLEVLDRAFATSDWFNLFPTAFAEVLPRHVSDHSPLLIMEQECQKPFTNTIPDHIRAASNRLRALQRQSEHAPPEMMEQLVAPLLEDEVEWAVRRHPSNKALGPDGFSGEFYKAFWPVLNDDLVRTMRAFQETKSLPVSWGSSHVVFIPKCAVIREVLKETQTLIGLEVYGPRIRSSYTKEINERVLSRIQGWKGNQLTLAGRWKKAVRGFLWGGAHRVRPIHLLNWEAVTLERSQGGLGIRRLTILRRAVLAKLAYKFLLSSSQISKHFKFKYNGVVNPWEALPKRNSSAVWKALCKEIFTDNHWFSDPNGSSKRVLMCILLRRIWKARNAVIFQNRHPDARWTIMKALSLASECLNLYPSRGTFGPGMMVSHKIIDELMELTLSKFYRRCHQSKSIYIITDRSVHSITREAGAAFVIVCKADSSSAFKVIGAGYAGWPWSSPHCMEGEAIRLGVLFARKKGLSNLVTQSQVGAAEALAKHARRSQEHALSEELSNNIIRGWLGPFVESLGRGSSKTVTADMASV